MTKFIDLTLSGVSSGAVYAAVALALVLIWRATRIVNFAFGGLGSLAGAAWGAAILVLLPSWTNSLAHSLSLGSGAEGNLPFAIYGLVLIGLMLAWPSGIQGGLGALTRYMSIKRRRG